MRQLEPVARGFEEGTAEVVAIGERDAVDDGVQGRVQALQAGCERGELIFGGDVARDGLFGMEVVGEFLDGLLLTVALEGEDGGGEAPAVRHTQDECGVSG